MSSHSLFASATEAQTEAEAEAEAEAAQIKRLKPTRTKGFTRTHDQVSELQLQLHRQQTIRAASG